MSPDLLRLKMNSRVGQLTPRVGSDAGFLRLLWANRDFMYQFHRLAPPLPADHSHLIHILDQEFEKFQERPHALHWIVRDPLGQPWGLLSLTDISWVHRRAEVLLGVLPESPFGLATGAMLMLFNYYFRVQRFNKLYSLVFTDNEHSLKGTLHLGFKQEGLLKSHTFDPARGAFSDVIQTGLLKTDAFSPANVRLMDKLLKKR